MDDNWEKESPETQLNLIKDYCKRKGYNLIGNYEDLDESGGSDQRPAFQRMFNDITTQKIRIGAVLCYDLSRFSRKVSDLNNYLKILEENKVHFISISEEFLNTTTIHGKFLTNIFGSLAELQREQIIYNVKNTMINMAKKADFTGGAIPDGFDYNKDTKEISINEERATMIKKIFDLYVNENYSIRQLSRYFTVNIDEFPLRTDLDLTKYRKNKQLNEDNRDLIWNTSKIQRILNNPLYTGIFVYGRRHKTKSKNGKMTHKANPPEKWVWSKNIEINTDKEYFWNSQFTIKDYDFPPIIDFETYLKAQHRLSTNKKLEPQRISHKNKYALSGLIQCGCCGKNMNGRTDKRDENRTYQYYYCNTARLLATTDSHICNGKPVRADYVDQYVFDKLKISYVLTAVLDAAKNEEKTRKELSEKYDKEIQFIQNEVKELKDRQSNLLKVISLSKNPEDLVEELDNLGDDVRRKQKQLSDLQKEKEQANSYVISTEELIQFKNDTEKIFSSLNTNDLKTFFKRFLDRVVFHDKDNIEIYLKFNKEPFDPHYPEYKETLVKEELDNKGTVLTNEGDSPQSSCGFVDERTRVHSTY
ncbi:recombinase family protein [Niallia sp. RD1]|uniref:recombinase family protein n=1 Tax=Niallia sp. RD1 TaxID=2962858 RepID=UPI0020C1AB86|nr:recombinase family protein [Niallia sp. RD1]UTI44490.1 recombinase family protein [Niallia sp. RD1]